MTFSIKKRIYLSFALLVLIFVINGVLTIITINYTQRLSQHISRVIDPGLEAMNDFRKMMVESKMYATNWVFLRSSQEDKNALIKIHKIDFQKLKSRLNIYAPQFLSKSSMDSLNHVYLDFDRLVMAENNIMTSLQTFDDYNDPMKKFGAEQELENSVLPQTAEVSALLYGLIKSTQEIKLQENIRLERISRVLSSLIIFLAITIIILGFFSSFYMSKKIIRPINVIRSIIGDLSKGIIRKVETGSRSDEIGEMARSVNNLSGKLFAAASFASKVGARNFEAHYEPLSDKDVLGKAIIAMRDNLKRSEGQLHKANFDMKMLFSNIEEVFFSVDMIEKKLLQISPACEKVYGYNEISFGLNSNLWFELILIEDRGNIEPNFVLMKSGKPVIHEYRIRHKDGNIRWVETKVTPTLNKQGTLIRIDGVTSNISERKESEKRMYASEMRFRSLIENSTDMISMTDFNRKFIYVSPAVIKNLGYAKEELLSKGTIDIIHADDVATFNKFLIKVAENPFVAMQSPLIRAIKNDDTCIWMEGTTCNLLSMEGVNAIVSNFRDVTQRTEYEETLKHSNAELTKTNMELDKFVYSVSHDLRAPLSSMLGVVDISEEETEEPLMKEHLSMLKSSIKKLDSFIMDILDYSRNSRVEVKKEKIDFKDMLNDISNNLKYMNGITQKVNMQMELNDTLPFKSDKNRINMILNNLISNAVRYHNPNVADPFVNIHIDTSDTEVNIVIKDNGIGISKELQGKIFDMFFRVSENSVGSGLGLYIVKETIEKLNGRISVESELKKGTLFSIQIPNN